MMKGRADDRHLFGRHVNLNVLAMVDSTNFDAEPLVQDMTLSDFGLRPSDLTELVQIFAQATDLWLADTGTRRASSKAGSTEETERID